MRFALGAVAAGCGETACILGAAAITMACLLGDRRNLWILAGILVGGLAAFLAPGNAARWDGIAGGHRPDLIVAALAALPRTTGELLGLLPASWLCPAAPALAALALALATPMRRVGTSAALLILAGTLGGALLALLASNATVGCIEGRQANALWLYLVLGAAATGWAFLLPLGGRARLGLLLLWWALSWLQVAMLPTAWIGALLIAAVATAAAAWSAWSAWRSGKVNARAWLALSTLAAPGLLIACGDLWLAPQRRAEQWRRDAAVERLHDAGARRVRIPLLDPAHFPVTSSIGDLQSGHWATAGYAAWHRLDAVVVDPRLHEPRPDGLPTR